MAHGQRPAINGQLGAGRYKFALGIYPDTVRPLGAINGQRPTAHGPSCALAGRFWQANGARPVARFRALGAPVLTASWAITYKGADYIRAKKNRPEGRPAVTSCREN